MFKNEKKLRLEDEEIVTIMYLQIYNTFFLLQQCRTVCHRQATEL